MLSNGFARPLRLKRKPSRLLATFLVAIHTMALIALLQPLAVNAIVHTALFASLLLSAIYHVMHFRRQCVGQDDWVWQASGIWQRGDADQPYTLVLAKSLQTPWFVTLTLADLEQRQQRLLVMRDQLDADSFRRLRVRVKLHHDETAARSEDAV